MRRVDDLRPNPRSPRAHKKRKIQDLAKTIKALGFIGAVIVDEAGMILAGHARLAALSSPVLRRSPRSARGASALNASAPLCSPTINTPSAPAGTGSCWRPNSKNFPSSSLPLTSISRSRVLSPARSTR
ncbi:MAG: ParB N-terminal domain-containing protein, partial [Methylocystis sp.]|uniref:ParB N-terminal domain-containing protein n=1 Tax=Methylocystis sp. TaxID=1911079 RepID=UPI003DA3E987